jgi:hypothetical protein
VSIIPITRNPAIATVDSAQSDWLNVQRFDVVADPNVDNTAGFMAAIGELAARGGGVLYIPSGIYGLNFSTGLGPSYTGVSIPPGVNVMGDGIGQSIIRGIGASHPANSNGRLFQLESYTSLRRITIDGNSPDVSATLDGTAYSDNILRLRNTDSSGVTLVVVEDVEITRAFAGSAIEGLALNASSCTQVRFQNVYIHDNMATGLSIAGGDTHSYDIVADSIHAYRNGYLRDGVTFRSGAAQGVALYGVERSSFSKIYTWENAVVGFNAEWTFDTVVDKLECYDNGRWGIGLVGGCKRVTFRKAKLWNNGTVVNAIQPSASIRMLRGTDLIPSTAPQDIRFEDCEIQDRAGNQTFYFMTSDILAASTEPGFPIIIAQSHGAETWTGSGKVESETLQQNTMFGALTFPYLTQDMVLTPPINAATLISTAVAPVRDNTVTNRIADTYILKGVAVNDGYRWLIPIHARTRHTIRMRAKTAGRWLVRFTDGTTPSGQTYVVFSTNDISSGAWRTLETVSQWNGPATNGLRYLEIIALTTNAECYVELPQYIVVQWFDRAYALRYNDEICHIVREHFGTGDISTGRVGTNGWVFTSGSASVGSSSTNRSSTVAFDSNASGTYAALRLGTALNMLHNAAAFTEFWEYRAAAFTLAEAVYRIGRGNSPIVNPPAEFVGIEKLAADTQWQFVTTTGGVSTRLSTGVNVVVNAWLKAEYKRVDSNTVVCRFNDGTELAIQTNIPSGTVAPFAAVLGTAGTPATAYTLARYESYNWIAA